MSIFANSINLEASQSSDFSWFWMRITNAVTFAAFHLYWTDTVWCVCEMILEFDRHRMDGSLWSYFN